MKKQVHENKIEDGYHHIVQFFSVDQIFVYKGE